MPRRGMICCCDATRQKRVYMQGTAQRAAPYDKALRREAIKGKRIFKALAKAPPPPDRERRGAATQRDKW